MIMIIGQNLSTLPYVLFRKFLSYNSIMWLLNSKIDFYLMRKNPHDRILKEEPKEQHLSTVPKSC